MLLIVQASEETGRWKAFVYIVDITSETTKRLPFLQWTWILFSVCVVCRGALIYLAPPRELPFMAYEMFRFVLVYTYGTSLVVKIDDKWWISAYDYYFYAVVSPFSDG